MVCFARKLSWAAAFCALFGCSGPVQIPPLPGSGPGTQNLDRVLHEQLTTSDIQGIFRSLNRTHHLDPLIPYLDTPSPEALAPVGNLISKHFYETLESPRGLPALLAARAERGSFSSWLAALNPSSANHAASVAALTRLVGDARFPALLKRDSALLSPEFAALWQKAATEAKTGFLLKFPETGIPVTEGEWVTDAAAFLTEPKNTLAVRQLAQSLSQANFGTGVLRALNQLGRKPGAFEGFSAGIAKLTATPLPPHAPRMVSQIERLLQFFETANRPTDGLFSVAEEKLRREPHAIREFTAQLQGMIPAAVRGFIREGLAATAGDDAWLRAVSTRIEDKPSPQWIEVFIAVRTAIENVTGPTADENAPDMFLRNLPIFLNSYAITRWVEYAAPKVLGKTGPWLNRTASFETVNYALSDFDVVGKAQLNRDVLRDFKAIGLEDFANDLDARIPRGGLGSYLYDFSPQGTTIREALVGIVDTAHQVRPFADGAAALRSIAYGITHRDSGFGFVLSDLESDNLVTQVNRWLAGTTLESVRKIKRILFDDLKIGDLSDDTKQLLLSLYDAAPAVRARAETLLATLPMLYEFDRPVRGLPTAFETYHALLRNLPSEDMGTVGAVFRFLSDTKLVEGAVLTPRYPGFVKFLQQHSGLGSFFHGLSKFSRRERDTALMAFESAFGEGEPTGAEIHVTLLADWLRETPAGARLALGYVHENGWLTLPSIAAFPAGERQWVQGFIQDGDFETLWQFLQTRGGPGDFKALTTRLRELSETSYLAKALDLLAHFKNARLQQLAQSVSRWERSGELRALLRWVDSLVPR